MKYVPREYQAPATGHMIDVPRSAIWGFMGSGKTVAALTAVDLLQLSGVETKPALVLAPKRVAQSTWPDEVKKWDHLSGLEVCPIIGTETQRLLALRNTNAGVFTINYENIPWLMETLNGKWPFGRIIADESTKLKNLRMSSQISKKGNEFIKKTGGSKRASAIAKVAHAKCTGWTNLTGTPSPNGLIDLWGQTWPLDKGERLGYTFESFKTRWFQSIQRGDYPELIPMPFAQAQISERLSDICMSLKAEDYFDLSEPVRTKVYVDLPDKARTMYREMEKKMYTEIEGIGVEAFNAASKSVKCHQLANGAAYVELDVEGEESPKSKEWREVHDEKIQALESIANEWNGSPILVAFHFKSDLARLMKAFPKGRFLDDNPKTISDWNAGKIPMLFAHPASAGHGLNLQDGGHILVYFSINWNLEEHMQIFERVGPVRQFQAGHNRLMYVYYLLARKTIDEQIMDRLDGKFNVQEALRDAVSRIRMSLSKVVF